MFVRLFVCLIVTLSVVFRPSREYFTPMETSPYRRKASSLDLCSVSTVTQHGNDSSIAWRTYFELGSSTKTEDTHTLAVELSLPVLPTRVCNVWDSVEKFLGRKPFAALLIIIDKWVERALLFFYIKFRYFWSNGQNIQLILQSIKIDNFRERLLKHNKYIMLTNILSLISKAFYVHWTLLADTWVIQFHIIRFWFGSFVNWDYSRISDF